MPPAGHSPLPVLSLAVFRRDGQYFADATYQHESCGCKVVGAGVLPAPFRVQFCASHSATESAAPLFALEPHHSPFAGCRTLAELRAHLAALNRLDYLMRQVTQ